MQGDALAESKEKSSTGDERFLVGSGRRRGELQQLVDEKQNFFSDAPPRQSISVSPSVEAREDIVDDEVEGSGKKLLILCLSRQRPLLARLDDGDNESEETVQGSEATLSCTVSWR